MEATEQIKRFNEFFDLIYKSEILENLREGNRFIAVDFVKLIGFDAELAERLLEEPEEAIAAAEIAIRDSEFEGNLKAFHVRFKNLPESEYKSIWKIRSKDLGKFIKIKGFIRKSSDVVHGVSVAKFECPGCGNSISALQNQNKPFKEPTQCACGKKGKFRLLSKELYDLQRIVIEEESTDLESSQSPRSMLVYLKSDLTRPEIDKLLQPSKRIVIYGILEEKQRLNTTEFTKYMEANNVEVEETKTEVTPQEALEFIRMASTGTIFEDLAQSMFPSIHGRILAKNAITLQLVGGVHLFNDGKLEERGMIAVILIGSPGTGKSQLLKRAQLFIPNARYTGGRGASGIGLVATVTKDPEFGSWTLEPGVIPMCNKSMAIIDEIDKIIKEDLTMMNNVMINLKADIDKASIHKSLECDTIILAAANPKEKVFDNREPVWKQIGLPKDFIDRFDIVIPFEAVESESEQRKIAQAIFGKYTKSKSTTPIYNREKVMKYLSYARELKPKIPIEVEKYIEDNFVNLIRPTRPDEDQAYFSSRLLTSIIRFTVASAKIRLSEITTIEDATRAINLIIESLKKQDIIKNDGLLDVEKMEAIIPKSKRDKEYAIKEIMRNLQEKNKNKEIDYNSIQAEAGKINIDEFLLQDLITLLLRNGDMIEPRRGYYQLI